MWLYFPRMIGVHNFRLTALFITLHIAFGTYVVFSLFWQKQWTSDAPIDDYVSVVAKSYTDDASMRAAERQMWRSKPCNETGHLSMRKSVNVSCPKICSTLNPTTQCINAHETAGVFDGSRELFFVTSFVDTLPGGTFTNATFYSVPFEKYQEVQLQYGIKLPFLKNKFAMTPKDDTREREATLGAECDLFALSSVNVTTRLLNARGQHVKEIKPPGFLGFSLSEALELADLGGMLDAKSPFFMYDNIPSQVQSYSTRRFTGVEIVISIHCRLRREYWSMQWAAVICDASFLPGALEYAAFKRLLPGGIVRHYGGVRARITTRVDAEFLDLSRAYQALVGAIVVASLPRLIVMFFARFCLGSCSKVYRSLIWDRFSLRDHITSTIMRWMVGFASHKVLAKEDGLISPQFLAVALRECLRKRSQRLNDEDLDALIRMCMQSVANTAYLSRRSKRHHQASEVLDSDNFSVACLNGEAVAFDDILCLLDTTKKRHLVERCFMPRELIETGAGVNDMKTLIRRNSSMNDVPAGVGIASLKGLSIKTKKRATIVRAESCQDSNAPDCRDVTQDAHVNVKNSADSCAVETTRDTPVSEIADLKAQVGFLQNALQHQVLARLDTLERNVGDLFMKSLPRPSGTMDGSPPTCGASPACETPVSTAEAFPASLSASPTIVPKATSLEEEQGTGDVAGAPDPDLDVGAGATALLNETRTKVDKEPPESLFACARIGGIAREPPEPPQVMGAALETSLIPTSCDTLTPRPKRAPNGMATSHSANLPQVLGPAIIPGSGSLGNRH